MLSLIILNATYLYNFPEVKSLKPKYLAMNLLPVVFPDAESPSIAIEKLVFFFYFYQFILAPIFLIVFKNDGNEVFIESGSCIVQLPPKVNAAIVLIINTL